MTRLGLVLAGLLLAGCARFEPRPLHPAQSAAGLEHRSLEDPGLKAFLEQTLDRDLTPWPQRSWSFETLTQAAFYYHPSLEVARAQWAVARGGQVTAAQRPNPTLNVTPGYDTSLLSPSPWLPLGYIDLPIETAGKRKRRRAQAAQLAEAARLNIAAVAWQVRSNLRGRMLDLSLAQHRAVLLEAQMDLQQQIVQRLEQQIQAGAIAPAEVLALRVALVRTRLDLAEAQRLGIEARARLAEAIGIPNQALEGVTLLFDPLPTPETVAPLTSAEAQRAALVSRSDILGALAQYSASEAALSLEIAKQYPDVHLAPGYQFDQGLNKWSLGITVDLPILNQNQGPIAEAEARRHEAAARVQALQATVLGEVDRAVALVRTSTTNLGTYRSLAEAQARQREAIAAQVDAGANDRLSLLTAQFEEVAAQLVQLDGQAKLEQAFAALEDAIQRPLPLPEALFHSQ